MNMKNTSVSSRHKKKKSLRKAWYFALAALLLLPA